MADNPTFAEKLVIAGWDGEMDSLLQSAEKANYHVIKQSRGRIEVKLLEKGKRQKESRYNLPRLLERFRNIKMHEPK